MKKILFISIMAILLIFAIGCSIIPSKSQTEAEITLYFANKDYVVTGDMKYPRVLPEKRKIVFDEKTLEQVVIDELKRGTTNDNMLNMVTDKIYFKSITNDQRKVYVDLSSENLNGSSLQEELLVEQIVQSLLALEDVNLVQFLVDGNVVESLMGHVDVSKPFEK